MRFTFSDRRARSRRAVFMFAVVAMLPRFAKAQASVAAQSFPFLDPALPIETRVNDLVARMTLDEKISQMVDHAAAIPRLRVPSYVWWNESLHGVAFAGHATTFPQVIGMAATWDTALVRRMGDVTATEARAKYHESVRANQRAWFYGLTFWAPNVNIFRDPRWGRGQETYGEDPFLTSRLGVAFVKGMQGDDPRYLKVVATPKHFAVHSGPEPLRHQFDVDVSPHDLEDTYLPAFRATLTEGRAQSVMCAYNAIDGVPACANTVLLRDHLRRDWGFTGYVVSDCSAVADVVTGHKYAVDFAHAAAAALKAGTDLECGFAPGLAYQALGDAVKQNLIAESDIDTAVRRLFTARFQLGMFDPPESYAYGRTPMTEVTSAPHRALALQAARESMVLLKNKEGILPLGAKAKRIAVVGPTAELVQSLQGNYNANPVDPVTPVAGIEKRFTGARVTYAQGSVLVDGLPNPIPHSALRTAGAEGLRGEYFDNIDFRGAPAVVRIDRVINFNWDKASPAPGIGRNDYSVRWTGTLTPPGAGDYRFDARVNNCYGCQAPESYRIYVDGTLIADGTSPDFRDSSRTLKREGTLHFADTKPHEIKLEYVHRGAAGGIDLRWLPPANVLRAEAVATARAADVVVAVLGLSPELEGEEMPVRLPGFSGGDRTDIRLPAVQRDLLYSLSATGVPIVVVLTSGSALAFDDNRVAAVIEAWYPGEEGGTAIAETLAGDNNPAGRLPITFYASDDQLPPFDEYAMADRTYRYFRGTPRYGFGFGLSYSTFHYGRLSVPSASVRAGDSVTISVSVTNQGKRAGDEVVQLYLTQPRSAVTPAHTLAGFARVHLPAGSTRRVTLRVAPRTLAVVNEKGDHVIVPGAYGVSVGGAQPGVAGVRGSFTIRGSPVVLPR